jgi:hypothetical protein
MGHKIVYLMNYQYVAKAKPHCPHKLGKEMTVTN